MILKDFKMQDLVHDNSAYLVQGYFEIPDDGYYIFAVDAENGSKLFVSDQLIIDTNGVLSQSIQSFSVPFKKGTYPIRLELLWRKGSRNLQFLVFRTTAENDQWWRNEFFKL